MGKPRDTQQSRLYAAERAAFPEAHGIEVGPLTLDECQALVARVLGRAWYRQRWSLRQLEVGAGRGARHAFSRNGWAEIVLPRWARSPVVVLHELAHATLGHGRPRDADPVASHGPEFASLLLLMVYRELGKDAATRLREAYRLHRVRYRTAGAAAMRKG